MKKSALQVARAAYQPKLPKALQGPVVAVEGASKRWQSGRNQGYVPQHVWNARHYVRG